MLIGSNDSKKRDYTTISVGKDITLEGWSGIFINHNNKTAYGILVNMDGTINALNDINGDSGIGIYINGNIQNENNSPIINLNKTSIITSTGTGIYAAGYATYYINGAYISGKESALGIKSGIFNILDGNIIGTGLDKTPTTGNNNGINPTGAAIQIESNPGYKGDIELNIKNGTIESKHSNVIYEYTVNNTSTKVKHINIIGGTFLSNNKETFLLSNSFKNTHQKFISGGKFSSNPSNYLKDGYTASKDENSLYEIISNTMKEINTSMNIKPNKKSYIIYIIIPIIIIREFILICDSYFSCFN